MADRYIDISPTDRIGVSARNGCIHLSREFKIRHTDTEWSFDYDAGVSFPDDYLPEVVSTMCRVAPAAPNESVSKEEP